jgi:NitT/TauT family transport system ATP-binding protein
MRQRVSLARALALEPDLLLLDEPYTGLDEALKQDVRGLVERRLMATNAAAVLVTHDRGDIPDRVRTILRLGTV